MVNGMRIPLRIAGAASVCAATGTLGISWWYSAVLTDPRRYHGYPDRVLRADRHTVTLAESRLTAQPGHWGLRWPDGLAQVGPVTVRTGREVVRELLAGPVPPVGPVVMDTGPFDPDPAARGLPFDAVEVPTPIGPCPAWLVPGGDSAVGDGGEGDWLVAVHGRGGSRREALRVLPALHGLGLTTLVVTYRNDTEEGAPPSPDGHDHLGDTEWLDVEAAVRFAVDRGARRVVLFGWSMGAAIIAAFLDRSALARVVVATVWDAPLLDWRATLRQQARNRRLPPSLIGLVAAFTSRRIGIDFDRFDLVERPPTQPPPTLVVHSSDDTVVPVAVSRALAAAAPALGWPLRYVEVAGAEHTASWNADPEAYETTVREFLQTVLGTHALGSAGTM